MVDFRQRLVKNGVEGIFTMSFEKQPSKAFVEKKKEWKQNYNSL